MSELTRTLCCQEELALTAYLVDFDRRYACQQSGMTPHALSKLLSDPGVKPLIDDMMSNRCQTLRTTRRRILEELARLAFSDPVRDIQIDDDGNVSVKPGVDPGATRAISSFKKRTVDRAGVKSTTVELTFHPKVRALELLGNRLAMWTQRHVIERHEPDSVEIDLPGGGKMKKNMKELTMEEMLSIRSVLEGKALPHVIDSRSTIHPARPEDRGAIQGDPADAGANEEIGDCPGNLDELSE